jgi:hypothetical protein
MRKGLNGNRRRAASGSSAVRRWQAMPNLISVRRRYDATNLEAAKRILAGADGFGGNGAGLIEWAQSVVQQTDREGVLSGKLNLKEEQ